MKSAYELRSLLPVGQRLDQSGLATYRDLCSRVVATARVNVLYANSQLARRPDRLVGLDTSTQCKHIIRMTNMTTVLLVAA